MPSKAPNLPAVPSHEGRGLSVDGMREKVQAAIQESRSPSTRRAYAAKWEAFATFCDGMGVASLPASPETVAAFLVAYGESRKVASIRQAVAAIGAAHEDAGCLPLPTKHAGVKRTVAGLVRTHGAAVQKKRPLIADLAKEAAALAARKGTLQGLRDRALLLFGFAGAFRRSEIESLNVESLTFTPEGCDVHLARSKTDQTGEGQTVSIIRGGRHCPVAAVEEWLAAASIESGPVFRSFRKGDKVQASAMTGRAIADTVKAYAAAIGFEASDFGGHSLRAGFITSAAEKGAAVDRIRDVSRHKSVNVLMGYVRHADRYKNHAGEGLL